MFRFPRPAAAAALVALTAPLALAQIPEDKDPVTTASGLQYSVLKEGDGSARPKISDTVRVHYTGWLTDGRKFDSSRDRGTPADFPVNGVVAGFSEGLQLMTPGARLKLTIPAELGYGVSGSPPTIPGGATLVFDVELIAITKVGPELPTWTPMDPDETTTTTSGLAFQVDEMGTGNTFTGEDQLCMEWSLFTKDGDFVDSSMMNEPIVARMQDVRVDFLKELPALMRVGSTLRLMVPAGKGLQHPRLPADEPSHWIVTLRDVYAKPSFTLPGEEELTTTESGLKYKVLQEGAGTSPTALDTVKCHYTGWLTDGKEFDSSYNRGQPTEFPLSRVIKGWTEGVQLMKPGSKYLFVIPSELGYGARGAGANIPPNSTLVFVVELVTVR